MSNTIKKEFSQDIEKELEDFNKSFHKMKIRKTSTILNIMKKINALFKKNIYLIG